VPARRTAPACTPHCGCLSGCSGAACARSASAAPCPARTAAAGRAAGRLASAPARHATQPVCAVLPGLAGKTVPPLYHAPKDFVDVLAAMQPSRRTAGSLLLSKDRRDVGSLVSPPQSTQRQRMTAGAGAQASPPPATHWCWALRAAATTRAWPWCAPATAPSSARHAPQERIPADTICDRVAALAAQAVCTAQARVQRQRSAPRGAGAGDAGGRARALRRRGAQPG